MSQLCRSDTIHKGQLVHWLPSCFDGESSLLVRNAGFTRERLFLQSLLHNIANVVPLACRYPSRRFPEGSRCLRISEKRKDFQNRMTAFPVLKPKQVFSSPDGRTLACLSWDDSVTTQQLHGVVRGNFAPLCLLNTSAHTQAGGRLRLTCFFPQPADLKVMSARPWLADCVTYKR